MKWTKHILSLIVLFAFLGLFVGSSSSTKPGTNAITTESTGTTDYFEIKVNKVVFKDSFSNGIMSESAGEGNVFLVFNVTFKNIDSESRMFEEGDVFIDLNGKELKFDSPEPSMDILTQWNPYVTKTRNIAYKMPKDVVGKVYWVPGRNSNDVTFFLAEKTADKPASRTPAAPTH